MIFFLSFHDWIGETSFSILFRKTLLADISFQTVNNWGGNKLLTMYKGCAHKNSSIFVGNSVREAIVTNCFPRDKTIRSVPSSPGVCTIMYWMVIVQLKEYYIETMSFYKCQ